MNMILTMNRNCLKRGLKEGNQMRYRGTKLRKRERPVMFKTTTLDGAKLKEIANSSPSAELASMDLGMRERSRHELNINRTLARLKRDKHNSLLIKEDFIKFFEDLKEAGMGEILSGRSGHKRFIFKYDPLVVAESCLDGINHRAKEMSGFRERLEEAPYKSVMKDLMPNKDQSGGLRLSIEIPGDLDESKLKSIVTTLKQLSA